MMVTTLVIVIVFSSGTIRFESSQSSHPPFSLTPGPILLRSKHTVTLVGFVWLLFEDSVTPIYKGAMWSFHLSGFYSERPGSQCSSFNPTCWETPLYWGIQPCVLSQLHATEQPQVWWFCFFAMVTLELKYKKQCKSQALELWHVVNESLCSVDWLPKD